MNALTKPAEEAVEKNIEEPAEELVNALASPGYPFVMDFNLAKKAKDDEDDIDDEDFDDEDFDDEDLDEEDELEEDEFIEEEPTEEDFYEEDFDFEDDEDLLDEEEQF